MTFRLIECDCCGSTLATVDEACDCTDGERSLQAVTPLGAINLGPGTLKPEQVTA